MNQDRLSQFVDTSINITSGASENIQRILRKPDQELSVEDVTTLLGEL